MCTLSFAGTSSGSDGDLLNLTAGSEYWTPQTDKPYFCKKCCKGFTHEFTLNRHRRTVCGKFKDNGGKYLCKRCDRRYKSEGNLVRHQKYECGVKRQFVCMFCKHPFTQRCSLIRHMKHFHNSHSEAIKKQERMEAQHQQQQLELREFHAAENYNLQQSHVKNYLMLQQQHQQQSKFVGQVVPATSSPSSSSSWAAAAASSKGLPEPAAAAAPQYPPPSTEQRAKDKQQQQHVDQQPSLLDTNGGKAKPHHLQSNLQEAHTLLNFCSLAHVGAGAGHQQQQSSQQAATVNEQQCVNMRDKYLQDKFKFDKLPQREDLRVTPVVVTTPSLANLPPVEQQQQQQQVLPLVAPATAATPHHLGQAVVVKDEKHV